MIEPPLPAEPFIHINLDKQTLSLQQNSTVHKTYVVSTAKNGAGEKLGSECTPRGWHRIRAKIGSEQPLRSVFRGRRPTGEIYSQALATLYPDRDWILSRILWFSGLQSGINRFGDIATAKRYIYIHGSPDHCVTGHPNSHGCIRMKNAEIIELFDQVHTNTLIYIR